MRKTTYESLKVDDIFQSRRGKKFQCLEKDVKTTITLNNRNDVQFRIRIYDPEFAREYDTHAMSTDPIEILDDHDALRPETGKRHAAAHKTAADDAGERAKK